MWCSRNDMTSSTRHAACVTVFCVLFAGCAWVAPKDEGPPLKQATAEELLALLRQRETAMQSMKGLFSAKVRGGLLPIASRVEGAVYYRRPDAMRVRGFTPVGGELFEYVQADDQYTLRLPTMGRVWSGRQSDMSELGKLARPFQLSVWAMTGLIGNGAIAKGQTVALTEEGDRYRLDVFDPGSNGTKARIPARRLWFDRRTLLVVQEDRLESTGEVEVAIQYDDFRPINGPAPERVAAPSGAEGGLWRPFKIVLEDGRGRGSVQVIFHEIVPNQALNADELGQPS